MASSSDDAVAALQGGADDTALDGNRAGEGAPGPHGRGVGAKSSPLPPVLPQWKQKLAKKNQEASAAAAALLTESRMREQEAQKKLAQLKARAQRELSRATSFATNDDRVCGMPTAHQCANANRCFWSRAQMRCVRLRCHTLVALPWMLS